MRFDELLDAAFSDEHNDLCSCEMCVDTRIWFDTEHIVGFTAWWKYF